jgi:hypothetical protein
MVDIGADGSDAVDRQVIGQLDIGAERIDTAPPFPIGFERRERSEQVDGAEQHTASPPNRLSSDCEVRISGARMKRRPIHFDSPFGMLSLGELPVELTNPERSDCFERQDPGGSGR